MRWLLLFVLSSCWTGPDYSTMPHPIWCEFATEPDIRCEPNYIWINQAYRYRGRWFGGHYVPRETP